MPPARCRRRQGLNGLLAVMLGLLADAGAAQALRLDAPVEVEIPLPPTLVRGGTARHVLYELHLRNFRRSPLELTGLQVLDPASGESIARYAGDELLGLIGRPGLPREAADRQILGGGSFAVVFVGLSFDERVPSPPTLRHVIELRPVGGEEGKGEAYRLQPADLALSTRPPVTLGPPVVGSGWLAANALSNASGHRRTIIPIDGRARIAQRYAIDWIQFGTDGYLADPDPSRNEHFHAYGAALLAVADGRVVAVHNGVPENTPFAGEMAVPITLETVAGNSLILDIGAGRYVLYAHLQPDSMVVELGQRVRRGELLARLGNSGNSDAPHLHLHVTDAPSALGAEGMPYVFESFTSIGRIGNLDAMLEAWEPWQPSEGQRVERHEALPLDGEIVAFEEGHSP